MDFPAWIRQWLARHPLKEPACPSHTQYTAQVMERVRGLAPPPTGLLVRLGRQLVGGWPRVALVAATAVVLAVLLVTRPPATQLRLAEEINQEAALLAALDEPLLLEAADDMETLARELESVDTWMVLAESDQGLDEAWIEETLLLLEELDAEPLWDDSGEISDETWFEELERLDDRELSASS